MTASPSTETAGKGKTASADPDLKDRIWKTLEAEGHRAYSSADFLPILRMKSPKDPEKEAKNREQILGHLREIAGERMAVEVSDGVFKARLYFDGNQKLVEHAFIGGTLNTHYRFESSFFRLNLGVLSIFFYRPEKGNIWKALVKDITLGREYVLSDELKDGLYYLGSAPGKTDKKSFLEVKGLYIEKPHIAIELSGESVRLEDQGTATGSRVDTPTPEGMKVYRKAARTFLEK
ncbi:MAG TPA: hypothetical protein VIU33_05750, partial [Nitrospiria bacterium]